MSHKFIVNNRGRVESLAVPRLAEEAFRSFEAHNRLNRSRPIKDT